MRLQRPALVLAAAGLIWAGMAEAREPGTDAPRYPGAPRTVLEAAPSPYAMNYTDEAAQSLGVKNGHWDAFSIQPAHGNSYVPIFSGGIDRRGAMLKLQWHPGE